MRSIWIGLLAALAASCTSVPDPAHVPPTQVVEGPAADSLDRYLTRLTELGRFNGVVLVRKDGKLLLHKPYTMDYSGMPELEVGLESQFDLRSVSKLLAQVAILDLEKEGLLDTRAPLSRYLPEFPRGGEITIQHLMEHRSGLPREFSRDSILHLEPEGVYRQIQQEVLEFPPGTDQRYSNVGYQLLYYLIGNRTGMPFRTFLEKRYFNPLGMGGTGSNFTPQQHLPEHYAYGHFEDGDGNIRWVDGFLADEARMGNFHTTAADMDRFLGAVDSARVASLLDQGVLSHAGGTRGKRAYVHRDFNNGYTLVFLANYDKLPFEALVRDLVALTEGRSVELPREIRRTATVVAPELLERYTGVYDFADAGHLVLELRLERDTLWVYQEGKNNGPLFPESETVFFGDPTSAESLTFEQDSTGNYTIWMDFQGVRWKGLPVE